MSGVRDRSVRGSMRRAVGWACAGGIISYASASMSTGFAAVVGFGAAATWMLGAGADRVAPKRAINAGLLGVVALAIVQALRLGFTVGSFAFFIGSLLVVKLLDLRRASDWGQALTLATALMVSAVLTSNELRAGALLLVSSVLLLRALVRYQIFAACERGWQDGRAEPDAGVWKSLGRLQWVVMVAAAAIGSVVFVVLPRELGTDAFGRWGGAAVGQATGFSDEVELGQPGVISQSPTPVMDVTVLDRTGRNMGSLDAAPLYLRGAVLEEYDRGRWRQLDPIERRAMVRSQFIPAGVTIRPWLPPRSVLWDMELRVTMRNATPGGLPLFTVWEPLELSPLGAGRFIAFDPAIGFVIAEQTRGRLEYRVRTSDPRMRQIEIDPGARRARPVPTVIPEEVAGYAQSVLRSAGIEPSPDARAFADDAGAVRVMERVLRANFAYTLEDQPTPPGRDATEWFLTERRVGHCEYFASALALMCRAVGIDARVITGYIVSDFNEVTGQYVVRESSAHAWVEAQVGPGVWMTFDATPRAEFHQIHQPDPGFWRSVKKLYESIEYAWVTGVVAFDAESRQRTLGPLSSDFGLTRTGTRLIERLRTGGTSLVLRAGAIGLAVFFGSVCAGMLLARWRGALMILWASLLGRARSVARALLSARMPPERALSAALLEFLTRAGVPKPEHVPLRSHLGAVGGVLDGERAAAASGACDVLYRARFGREPRIERGVFDEARRRLARSEKRSAPRRDPSG